MRQKCGGDLLVRFALEFGALCNGIGVVHKEVVGGGGVIDTKC